MRKFTYEELSTILAALRHLQNDIEENGTEGLIAMYPHFHDVDPLTVSEIDGLCEMVHLACNIHKHGLSLNTESWPGYMQRRLIMEDPFKIDEVPDDAVILGDR